MPSTLRSDVELAQPITCLMSDVDGVMTDGRIIYGSDGEEVKQFHVRDGLGIKRWLQAEFHFVVITARQSSMVQRRADELGIQHLHQGVGDKLRCAERLLQEFEIDWNAVCYIGDDLPDVAVMQQAGLSVAPADAARDAREAAHWTMRSPGGHGAVRELIERLLRAKNLWQFKAG